MSRTHRRIAALTTLAAGVGLGLAAARADDGAAPDRVRLETPKLFAERDGTVVIRGSAPAGYPTVRLLGLTAKVTVKDALPTFEVRAWVPVGRHEVEVVPVAEDGTPGPSAPLVVERGAAEPAEPSERPAPWAHDPADGPNGFDIRAYLQVPGRLYGIEDVALGEAAEITTTIKGQSMPPMTRRTAIVGRHEGRWVVEIEDSNMQGVIQGLLVTPEGEVVKAWGARRRGEKPMELKLIDVPAAAPAPAPEKHELVQTNAGEFACAVHETDSESGRVRSFVGVAGLAKDVLVKLETSIAGVDSYVLTRLAREKLTVGEVELSCRVARYDNGQTMWMADRAIPGYGPMVRMESAAYELAVTSLEDDARPRLQWPWPFEVR